MRSRAPNRRLQLTKQGLAELQADLALLGRLRQEVLAERGENTGLAARQPEEWVRLGHELAVLDDRILRTRCDLGAAYLVDIEREGKGGEGERRVAVGCEVTLLDGRGEITTITIGGASLADSRIGRLSYDSPMARVLLGLGIGDQVEVEDGEERGRLRIVEVRPLSRVVWSERSEALTTT